MLRKCRRWKMELYLEQRRQRFKHSQKCRRDFQFTEIPLENQR